MQDINDFKKGDQQKEVWRRVVGYEELYMVSNLGRIKSLLISCNCAKCGSFIKDKNIKKLTQNHDRYTVVHLRKNGKSKTAKVHRLVAMAFLKKDFSLEKQVDHLDGNRSNNNIKNLRWCTYLENYINRDQRRFNKRADKDDLILSILNSVEWVENKKILTMAYIKKKLNKHGFDYLIKAIKNFGHDVRVGKYVISIIRKRN